MANINLDEFENWLNWHVLHSYLPLSVEKSVFGLVLGMACLLPYLLDLYEILDK